ncbi:MAG: hypothetical protein K0B14_16305, partial [Anaerolineaceae bacterium]|nr:hypothetical protein [Anaerolineaceae bacterium]
ILKNYYALELMMAPYAIGHMKISFLLDALGCPLRNDERFQLYLTNTLEMEEINQINIPGIGSLSEESRLAGRVKKQEPILVIMGNPPYSGISSNKNEWTEKLLKEDLDGAQSYYKVDGQPLGEKKLWLQDDYVKFLRFAQWKVQKAGKGIVAMITNHGYLDNPTFRGMRQSLLKTFDKIFILDLHGNSQKKETAPDGGKDENVFDIRQGVAISLFVKNTKERNSEVFYFDIFGKRQEKYEWLISNRFNDNNYKNVKIQKPNYFFNQHTSIDISYYQKWLSIDHIIPNYVTGIVTARDKFVIGFSKQEITEKMKIFGDLSLPDEFIKLTYELNDTRGWKLSKARKLINETDNINSYMKEIFYRPFDTRFIIYTPVMVDWGRFDFMNSMLREPNLAIILPKRVEHIGKWQNVFITDNISEHVAVSLKTTDYHFPLYIFQNNVQLDWTRSSKETNIRTSIYSLLEDKFNSIISGELIFQYIYAILHSVLYREKYVNFLRMDFPRIPFPSDYELFLEMGKLGSQLVDLHLLKSTLLDHPTVKYQGCGDDHTISKPEYSSSEKRVFINPSHFFEGVEPEVWEYQIGGYQVMNKYLKDRKGRKMDDPRHYIHIATALQKTIEIQEEIDAIYPEVEKDVIDFS